MSITRRRLAHPLVGAAVATAVLGLAAAPSVGAQPVAAAAQVVPGAQVPLGSRFIPSHVRGDREFAGHGPQVVLDATLVLMRSRIDVRLHMRATETMSDWTTVEGTRTTTIYYAPTGLCVSGVSVGTVNNSHYRDTDHDVDVLTPGGASFVSKYEVVGDTNGSEAGTRTGVTVYTKAFTVRLVPC